MKRFVIENGWEKSSGMSMFLCTVRKDSFSLYVWAISKEEQPETHVGQIDETSGSGGTNNSARSGMLGVHAACM